MTQLDLLVCFILPFPSSLFFTLPFTTWEVELVILVYWCPFMFSLGFALGHHLGFRTTEKKGEHYRS